MDQVVFDDLIEARPISRFLHLRSIYKYTRRL